MRAALFVAIGLMAAAPGTSQTTAAGFEQLIGRIETGILEGKINEVAPLAAQAAAMAPDRHEGHLYLGIVRYRQDALALAQVSLQRALNLAPVARKRAVADVYATVSNTLSFRENMATAEEAERLFQPAKAARNYASAWWLFPDRVDIAAKALKGLTSTNGHFDAARIWNALTQTQKQENETLLTGVVIDAEAVKAESDRRLASLRAAIEAGDYKRALDDAIPMSQADSAEYEPVAAALQFLGSAGDEIVQVRVADPERLIRLDLLTAAQLGEMIERAQFRSYLVDVVGGDPDLHLESLRKLIAAPAQIDSFFAELQTIRRRQQFSYRDVSTGRAYDVTITPDLRSTDGCNVVFVENTRLGSTSQDATFTASLANIATLWAAAVDQETRIISVDLEVRTNDFLLSLPDGSGSVRFRSAEHAQEFVTASGHLAATCSLVASSGIRSR